MKYLIDTHVFIWFMDGNSSFSPIAKSIMLDKNNEIVISIASLWEISIKTSIGKLPISRKYNEISDVLYDNLIEILPLTFAHTVENNRLPFHHRDPFDRIIAAQAIVENMDFISADAAFDNYFVGQAIKRIW
jgi:PIN domain nuclease of toxin-antitoxin system